MFLWKKKNSCEAESAEELVVRMSDISIYHALNSVCTKK